MGQTHSPDANIYFVPHSSKWPFVGSIAMFVTMVGVANWLNDSAWGMWAFYAGVVDGEGHYRAGARTVKPQSLPGPAPAPGAELFARLPMMLAELRQPAPLVVEHDQSDGQRQVRQQAQSAAGVTLSGGYGRTGVRGHGRRLGRMDRE